MPDLVERAPELGIEDVLKPEDSARLRDVVVDLARQQRAFCPVGTGSTLGRGAPLGPCRALVSTAALDSITRLDRDDLTCGVQPGLSVETFQHAITEAGLAFEPGPFASAASRTIGGILGEAPPSSRGFDRASLRSQVLGITAIDGNGRRFRCGGNVVKNVAGYDVSKLFVGSGGAWFVVTEIQLRLVIRPHACVLLCSASAAREESVELWRKLRRELVDARAVDLVFEPNDAARIEVLVAGSARLTEGFAQGSGLDVVSDGPEVWHEWRGDPAGPSSVVLRGRLDPSAVPKLLETLPSGCLGRIHARGAFEVHSRAFDDTRFPPRSIVRRIAGEGEAQVTPVADGVAALGGRLSECFGPLVTPGRLSFDTEAGA